jgi:protein N-terminal methyltransferase
VNGVLGGYESVHEVDSDTSASFLDSFKDTIGHGRAVDCGAGMGRVTKKLLIPRFDVVDLIEPAEL